MDFNDWEPSEVSVMRALRLAYSVWEFDGDVMAALVSLCHPRFSPFLWVGMCSGDFQEVAGVITGLAEIPFSFEIH